MMKQQQHGTGCTPPLSHSTVTSFKGRQLFFSLFYQRRRDQLRHFLKKSGEIFVF